jgi:hypothetical protein
LVAFGKRAGSAFPARFFSHAFTFARLLRMKPGTSPRSMRSRASLRLAMLRLRAESASRCEAIAFETLGGEREPGYVRVLVDALHEYIIAEVLVPESLDYERLAPSGYLLNVGDCALLGRETDIEQFAV